MECTATELLLGTATIEESLFNDSLDERDINKTETLPPVTTEHSLDDSLDFELTQLPYDDAVISPSTIQQQINDNIVPEREGISSQAAGSSTPLTNSTTDALVTNSTIDALVTNSTTTDVGSNALKVVPSFGRKKANATKKQAKHKPHNNNDDDDVKRKNDECSKKVIEEKKKDDQCVPENTTNLSKPKSFKKSWEQKQHERDERQRETERKRDEREQKKCEAQKKKAEKERMKKEKQLEIEQRKIEREQKKIQQALKKTENRKCSKISKSSKKNKRVSDITNPQSETNDDDVEGNMNQNDPSEIVDKIEKISAKNDEVKNIIVIGVTEPNESATLPEEDEGSVAAIPPATDDTRDQPHSEIQHTDSCDEISNEDTLNNEMTVVPPLTASNKTCIAVKVEKLKIVFGKSKSKQSTDKPINVISSVASTSTLKKVKTTSAIKNGKKSLPIPRKKLKRQHSVNDSNKESQLKQRSKRSGPVWVQCESCQKWRQLTDCDDPQTLPNTWNCSMNTGMYSILSQCGYYSRVHFYLLGRW